MKNTHQDINTPNTWTNQRDRAKGVDAPCCCLLHYRLVKVDMKMKMDEEDKTITVDICCQYEEHKNLIHVHKERDREREHVLASPRSVPGKGEGKRHL